MRVTFVGHPLVDELSTVPSRLEARAQLDIAADAQVLALLPGSRGSELKHHAVPFLRTASWCASKRPGLRILVPVIDDNARDTVAAAARQVAAGLDVRIVVAKARQALAAADCALVASGTATLEAMLLGCPMIVAYRASWLSYALIRPLLRIRRFSLPNLLAGSDVVPEFIQGAATPERMGPPLLALLSDPARRDSMRIEFARLAASLQGGGSGRAADAVLELLA
jgi:lipid-A-disaccharide synthase